MKLQRLTQAGFQLQLGLLLVVMGMASGCAYLGQQRKGDTAAMSYQTAAMEVQAERQALDRTMAALNEMMSQPSPDLKQPLKHYSTALNRLIAAADRTEATGVKMAQRNADYLQDWDKQIATIEYEHIREVSQARKEEVKSRCEAINHRYADSQAAVHPVINYLEDIRRAINVDLTANGLESMKPVAQNAATNAEKVQSALEALENALADSGTKMSSVTAAAQMTQ